MARNRGRELWDALIKAVGTFDPGPDFESSGYWSADKLYFVCQYLEQTTSGMKNRNKWPSGLTYIDLFAGSGLTLVDTGDGHKHRFPGSPIIAASTPSPFDRLVLVERDPEKLKCLVSRLGSTPFNGTVYPIEGDANSSILRVAELVPRGSLNVAFVDPYSLDIHFESIRLLAKTRALDLIILFSDRFDLGRNVHKYYYPDSELSKLDLFLGCTDWRVRLDALDNQTGPRVRELFAEIYGNRLRSLGYKHQDNWVIDGPNGPAFRLFYASKHERGLEFCRIARTETWAKQRGLFGV